MTDTPTGGPTQDKAKLIHRYEELTLEEYGQRIDAAKALPNGREKQKEAVLLHSSIIHDVKSGKYTREEASPIVNRMLDELFGIAGNRRRRSDKKGNAHA